MREGELSTVPNAAGFAWLEARLAEGATLTRAEVAAADAELADFQAALNALSRPYSHEPRRGS